jgi:hypothetical protein
MCGLQEKGMEVYFLLELCLYCARIEQLKMKGKCPVNKS